MNIDNIIEQTKKVRAEAARTEAERLVMLQRDKVILSEWASKEIRDHLPLIEAKMYQAATNGLGWCTYKFDAPNASAKDFYTMEQRDALARAASDIIEPHPDLVVQAQGNDVALSWTAD